jgi:MBG domain-containing protein
VTLNSNPNYNVTKANGNLHISPKDASVTADNKGKTYGDDNPALTATVVGQVAGGDAINYSLATSALKLSGVGDYPITVNLGSNPNYNVTKTNGNLHISPKDASVTADNKGKTYGDDNPALTATVVGQVPGGDSINYTLGTAAVKFSNVGDYAITVTLGSNPNYNVTPHNGTLTINKASQTITWANPADITIGTPLSSTQLNATVAGVAGGTPPGALTYTPPAGTVLGAGANQALKVDAAATINYNAATKTVYINVIYAFNGFLPPVDNIPIWNSVKAGQTIPIKWQLTNNIGTIICDLSTLLPPPNGLTSIQVTCPNGPAIVDAIEEVLLSPGSTVFRCDGTQYIYNWQTSKSWAGTCRAMTVRLADGTTHTANFTFTK